MAILIPSQAKHFLQGYVRGRTIQQSFRTWRKHLALGQSFREGASGFDELRDLSAGEIERLALLSASHFRRAHDCFGEISAAWAYVTLYYGAFFAAQALLGVFGVWIVDQKKMLSVQLGTPGQQEFAVSRFRSPSGSTGSHALFWELYYGELSALVPYLNPIERFAVVPPGASFDWQCQERNRVNYDSFEAVDFASDFGNSFSRAGFPSSLPGVLNTQYRFIETALALVSRFLTEFGLETDALDSICSISSRIGRVRELVIQRKPARLGNKVRTKVIYGSGR